MIKILFEPRRLAGRLSYWVLATLLAGGVSHATGPITTTVNDVVYRADGTPAAGMLLISWPAFVSADAISNHEVVDPNKFQGGLGKIIDGVVDCLNASAWAKPR